tara:strand:- start:3007 stop:3750 length:744 start_codon:yes stop_codon:yes gene_type:complete
LTKIKRLMIKAKKSLSQNFLKDKNISKKITNLTQLKNMVVLEIGPGYGFMTDNILENKPKKLYIIEKDKSLITFLQKKYSDNKKVTIIEDDILKFNLNKFENLIIISNLPYNISTKIILYLFTYNKNILEMVFMIQKEVAEKFDYNIKKMNKYKFLTKIMAFYFRYFEVSPKVFVPQPKVKSTVVKFKFKKENIDIKKALFFSDLIFKNVRKKIYKNLNLEKTDNHILNKRVNQLTIEELLWIYNFI